MLDHANQPTYFPTPDSFRKWLSKNHLKEKELLVGFYKTKSGHQGITWSESVDEALCFGWIDGIRKSIDDKSYCIRFTPRKPNSIWSAINIRKAEELTKKKLMFPAGIEAFLRRTENKSRIYAYEKEAEILPDSFMKIFMVNKKAWKNFQSMAPWYQRTVIHWVISAKQEITKKKRLEELIKDSEAGRKIKSAK